jgi:hypothetical protein
MKNPYLFQIPQRLVSFESGVNGDDRDMGHCDWQGRICFVFAQSSFILLNPPVFIYDLPLASALSFALAL